MLLLRKETQEDRAHTDDAVEEILSQKWLIILSQLVLGTQLTCAW
jgi:hypothetical protein